MLLLLFSNSSPGVTSLPLNIRYGLSISDVLASQGSNSLSGYYPQWMDVHYSTDLVSGSLLNRFLVSSNAGLLEYNYLQAELSSQIVRKPWLGEFANGWVISTNLNPSEINTVEVSINSGTIPLKKSNSEHEFLRYTEPTYLADGTNIYFRNLDVTIALGFAGLVSTSSDIQHASDIFWSIDTTTWYILRAEDPSIDYTSGSIVLPTISNVTTIYASRNIRNLLTSGSVSVNGGPQINLHLFDFWNSFDELGLVTDLERFLSENNYDYWNRLRTSYPFMGASTEDGVRKTVSRRTGNLSIGYWDGLTTLTWAASSSPSHIWVHNLPQKQYVRNQKLRQSDSTYFGSKADWEQPYVFHDGLILTVVPVSGKITTSDVYQNSLYASYAYTNYSYTTSGNLIMALSRTSNTLQDIYEVAWCPNIEVNTLSKKSYRDSLLLTGNGTPTDLLLNLSKKIEESVRKTLGYSDWNNTYWFLDNEVSPISGYLPLEMDY